MAQKKKRNKNVEVTASATLKGVRVSARKTRLLVEMIKNLHVDSALNTLRFSNKKRGDILEKLLLSAIANARENHNADADDLWVVGGWVNEGTTLMRFKPRARGSAFPIRKKSSHITLQVGVR